MPTQIEHFGFWPLVAQRLARMAEAPNHSIERMEASRSGQLQLVPQLRLASTAHAAR